MNEYVKRYYNFVKDNLTMIAIIPTILGAIWQLYMLSSLSSNLVRFFSVSQLISDGILVLGFFIFPFIMSYQILMKRNTNEKKKEDINLTNADNISIIIVMIILILVFIRIVINFQKFIQLNDFESLFYILFISGFIANIIFAVIYEFFKSRNLVIIYSLCTFIMGFCIACCAFYKTSKNVSNIYNFGKILNSIESKDCYSRKPEVLYFNDKYIFIELEKNNKKSILIKKIDDLFEE
jgi:hypothetical protein